MNTLHVAMKDLGTNTENWWRFPIHNVADWSYEPLDSHRMSLGPCKMQPTCNFYAFSSFSSKFWKSANDILGIPLLISYMPNLNWEWLFTVYV